VNADRPNPSAFIKPSVWIFVCTVIIPLTILFLSAKFFNLKHGDVRAFSVPEKLLIVFAHTDDEVTNSGLIRHWANLGTEIKILTLTDGSANPDSDLKTCKPAENITGCRMRELSESAQTLGIRHIRTPLLPDSKLLQALPQATQIVSEELANFRPDAVMTMEPSGLNGLADHRAAFLSVAAAAAQSNFKFRAFLSSLPPPFEWFLPSRIPDNRQTSVKTFTTDELLRSAKAAVANAHQSQSKTIRGLTLGLGAEKLFTWINFETYGIFDSGELSVLVPKNN
jgi:LmbE family N-acetylglucosaminyl deacetylase